jgi:murein peptide amidase A
MVLGYSVRHRPVVAVELGDPDSPRRVLVVGCIHGSEPAGIAIATALARGSPAVQADLWIVPDLNPDGVAAGTRQNARGVDLNRNFPFRWRPLGPPGSLFYAGPRPLSEPESQLAARLIVRIRPVLAIWYHQALNVIDDSQGPRAAERRYAGLTGMREVPLIDYPGSAVGWEDATTGTTAFVVELPAGPLSPASVRRHVAAVDALLRSAGRQERVSQREDARDLQTGGMAAKPPHCSWPGRIHPAGRTPPCGP